MLLYDGVELPTDSNSNRSVRATTWVLANLNNSHRPLCKEIQGEGGKLESSAYCGATWPPPPMPMRRESTTFVTLDGKLVIPYTVITNHRFRWGGHVVCCVLIHTTARTGWRHPQTPGLLVNSRSRISYLFSEIRGQ